MLIKPLLPEDVKSKVVPTIEKLAKKLKGSIKVKEDWGKRHLAYPVQGQEEGYYIFFKMELEPEQLDDFKKGLVPVNDILRYLVIREDQL